MSSRYSKWPWPTVLPFAKEKWFTSLSTHESVSQSVRGVQTAGDAAVAFLLTVVAYRAYGAWSEGRFKTLRYHTTGMPPALIANDFSYVNYLFPIYRLPMDPFNVPISNFL